MRRGRWAGSRGRKDVWAFLFTSLYLNFHRRRSYISWAPPQTYEVSKDRIIFLIDCAPSMLVKPEDEVRSDLDISDHVIETCYCSVSLTCIEMSLRSLAQVCAPQIGCVMFHELLTTASLPVAAANRVLHRHSILGHTKPYFC